ncbi:DNA primase [Hymenobacter sp. BT18]|uniref:DNA primase n=1 Tax=Hymenobacter sp. BT18 TaxID=2835648 RepID=UPI00143EABEC|nr:DNA primase [Hymenobacter sp. BT18]QIX60893.1 DNA primase [Hymenobacter sp. BT18]
MLLSESTIDQVRQVDVLAVVSRYVKLKSRGHKHEACCPFHDESTPSFSVSPAKNIFKCFGCGAAGDGIGFVMKFKNLSFIEAVKEIASDHSVVVEYIEQTPEAAAEAEQKQRERESVRIALAYAAAYYAGNKMPDRWAETRKIQQPARDLFQLGHAEDRRDAFYQDAIRNGFDADVLERAGLVRKVEKEGRSAQYFDFFQDRVMFPICDARGRVVAFTGRLIKEPAADAAYKPGKYVNSPDTVWVKGDNLYGLHIAADAIRKAKFAYLVEGNVDVVQCHQKELLNTVAPCGTALTENQIKLLKQYTDRVVIIPDNDPAGMKALHKNAKLLLASGFRVEALLPAEGLDPDDMLKRKLHTPADIEKWVGTTKDYLRGPLLTDCERDAALGGHDKAAAIRRMGEALELIQDDTLRGVYYDDVAGVWPDFKRGYKLVKRGQDGLDKKALASMEDNERLKYFDFGFFEKDDCYYTYEGKGKQIRICTFTMDVLYFVLSQDEPKYVCKFRNMFYKARTTAISTDDFTSVATFRKMVARMGNFIFEGNEEHLNKIKIQKFHGVPEATQPRYMGYNPTGDFTTWANGLLFRGQFIKADMYGIVTLRRPVASIEELKQLHPESQVELAGAKVVLKSGQHLLDEYGAAGIEKMINDGEVDLLSFHYLPFASTLKLTDDDDDDYENERLFMHFEKKGLSFEDWSKLIIKAYGQNGIVMICFYLASLYRDIIFKANGNYFPILNKFGPRGAGKSKAAESLAAMFGRFPEDGINIEGGSTATGVRRYMASVQNGLIWLNEYKNTLPTHVIGMLKGIADGSGKMTGRATGGNETKNYKPRSGAILCGQDLPTKDPALLSRCIICEYSEQEKQRGDREAFSELRQLQLDGYTTSVTCEMLQYRDQMKEYRRREPAVNREIRDLASARMDHAPDDRAVLNTSSILTPIQILQDAGVKMPFTYEEARSILLDRIQLQTQIQATSDDVEQYFQVLTAIIGREVRDGHHFKIQKEGDGITKLFLRVGQVQGMYLAAATRMGITPLSAATVRGYLEKHRFFLEDRKKGVRFSEVPNSTSAMVFNYDMMLEQGIEFDTSVDLATQSGTDDPSRSMMRVTPLTSDNSEELVRKFIDDQSVDQVQHIDTLLRQFNSNVKPHISRDQFVKELMRYTEHPKRTWSLTFSEKMDTIRIDQPF